MALCSPSGIDIRADVWHGVLEHLFQDPKSVLSLCQTCTALHELSDHEQVWQSVATACWRQLAAVGTSYRTFKRLVLDDNRSNAAMALACNSRVCTYRFQQPLAFYECRLLQLQWWRTANSLRLYFDARGESDLRLPLDSSLAVIRLNDSPAAAAAQACQCRPAAAGGAGAAPVTCPACTGSFDLDAMGTRLLVHAPNACHTFVQKPGHYKGVLIWHAASTNALLKALLLSQPSDSEGPPAPQHSPQQAGRRSEAWEEWADSELEQQQPKEEEDSAAGTSSGSSSHAEAPSTPGPVSSLLRNCFRQFCSRSGLDNSAASFSHSSTAEPTTASSSDKATVASSSGSSQQEGGQKQGVKHALVFCYANDLRWYHTMRTPDYSITPLTVASPVPTRHGSSSDAGSKAAGRLCPSPSGRPYKQRGQVSKHLQRKSTDVSLLGKQEEGELAAAWKALPGACMEQCGALDQQLQAEDQVAEKLRWASLPTAVTARGEGWWV